MFDCYNLNLGCTSHMSRIRSFQLVTPRKLTAERILIQQLGYIRFKFMVLIVTLCLVPPWDLDSDTSFLSPPARPFFPSAAIAS
ncbi:hypothetical protein ABKN59_004150 [Abortiporus biennis]